MQPAVSRKQQAALNYAAGISDTLALEAMPVLKEICRRNNLSRERIDSTLDAIEKKAQIAIHFHPDRLNSKGLTVMESLLQQGTLQNQFESGISNGALAPFVGGQRDGWEQRLFGGVYQQEDAQFADRPKYGALDLACHADGPAPRFGSCYFKLSPSLSGFSTFSERDSYYEPAICGTIRHFEGIPYRSAIESGAR